MKKFKEYFSYTYIYIENKINLSLFLIEKELNLEDIIDLNISSKIIEIKTNKKNFKIENDKNFNLNIQKFGGFYIFKEKDYINVSKNIEDNDENIQSKNKIKYLTFSL
jgi:hypothetical protein